MTGALPFCAQVGMMGMPQRRNAGAMQRVLRLFRHP